MLAILPLISFLLFIFIFNFYQQDWRKSVLSGSVFWGVLLTIITEFLSLFRALTFETILGAWLLSLIILGWIYYRILQNKKIIFNKISLPKLTPTSFIFLGGIGFFLIITALIAIIAPPNNWDSMTYHMVRVVHWIQNRSVEHYPTYYAAQLVHPPFAEFIIMNLQILSGGDKWANLVQWFSLVGSIIGVSLIAKQLGCSERGQIFSSVFCATIPMGILQASSTQNDYVVAYWLVCLAYYTLLSLNYKKPPLFVLFAIASSLGLALLTKSSGYIYALPFLIWLFVWHLKNLRWKMWQPFLIVFTVVLVLNGNHYLRNLNLYGSPLATADYTDDYKIEFYTLPTFLSNIIRNLSLHVDIIRYLKLDKWFTPTTGITMKLVEIIHQFLGMDINDQRITFPVNSYTIPGLSFNEDVAVNPLHLLLILLSLFSFLWWRNKEVFKTWQVKGYLLTIISGFLLLCLMLKLQPYQSRHHLSAFILFAPFTALVISKCWNHFLITFLGIILLVASSQFLFLNSQKPLIKETNILNTSRNEVFFMKRQFLTQPYLEMAGFLKKQECTNIGLFLGSHGDVWEYPIWALTKENDLGEKFKFQHYPDAKLQSHLKLQEYPFKDFNPCGLIMIKSKKEKALKEVEQITLNNKVYVRQWGLQPITVLLKQ